MCYPRNLLRSSKSMNELPHQVSHSTCFPWWKNLNLIECFGLSMKGTSVVIGAELSVVPNWKLIQIKSFEIS